MRTVAAFIAALALALLGCAEPPAPRPAAEARPLAPLPTGTPPAPPTPWIGVVAPAAAVDVAPRFDGALAAVAVRAGDVVAAGDVLAVLDDRPLREELTAARAAAREASAAARRATVEVERARHRLGVEERGLAAGTSSQATVDEAGFAVRAAEAASAMARAAVAEAAARVERARSRLDETSLRAPFGGTVAARYHDVGAAVGPPRPVARIVGAGGLRLRFAVRPDEVARVAPGTHVVADLGSAAPVAAVVERVAPEVDQASQLVFVDAALRATDQPLTPGSPAYVRPGARP